MENRRKLAITVVATQAVITVTLAAMTFFLAGWTAAQAVFAGGSIGIIATVIAAARVLLGKPIWSPQQFLARLYRAEFQKALIIVVLVFSALHWMQLAALPLMLSLLAVLMANWLVLILHK